MFSSAPYDDRSHAQSTEDLRRCRPFANRLKLAVAFASVLLAGMTAVGTASATTSLGAAEHRVHEFTRKIHQHHVAVTGFRRQLANISAHIQDVRSVDPPKVSVRARRKDPNAETHEELRRRIQKRVRGLQRQRAGVIRRLNATQRRAQRLERAKARTEAYIWRIRPIGFCPVRGPHTVADDFGAARWADGKYHVHQGNDILGAYGAPIVAPFDGRAVAAPNGLGGMAVKVFGAAGYVYNAHLSRYGRLGPVTAGTVVGYVGTSGNAIGGPPHDHFEWHPGGGSAADPNPLLSLVC